MGMEIESTTCKHYNQIPIKCGIFLSLELKMELSETVEFRCNTICSPWWRHDNDDMDTFSALLARCEGNSPVTKGK